MFATSRILFALAISASVSLAACSKGKSKEEAPPAAAKTPPKDKRAPKDVGPKATADQTQAVKAVMKPYEECRGLLAADKADGIAACAGAMVKAAKAGEAEAPAGTKEHFATVAGAADALAKAPAGDVDAVRLAFGEVSKPIVALLTAVPTAAKDYHVFECPMAKGYKRWAQTDKQMANPYMGTKMLECGSEVHDHHKGMTGDGHMKAGEGHMKADDHAGMNH